jgi:hypothetical protein
MKKFLTCAFAVPVAALLAVVAAARPQNSDTPGPTRLGLEIVFLKGQPPSLYPVAGPQSRPSGGYTLRFGRVAGWQPPDGALPPRAVQVASRLEDGVIKVRVSVLTGRETIEREEPAATLDLSVGQGAVVTELTRFGVEPIEIKAVRVPARATVLPQVVNKTESLVVTGLVTGPSTIPAYEIRLRNASAKDVVGLEVNVVVGGRIEVLHLPRATEGRPLIPAGGEYKTTVVASYQIRPASGDRPPDLTRNHDCVIRSAVFNDGTYEGEPASASRFRAGIKGRQLQLRRVTALLQEALGSPDDAGATLLRLKAGLSALKTDTDEAEAGALLQEFSALPADVKARVLSELRGALSGMKKTASEDLSGFEKAHSTAALDKTALRSWLLATKQKYEEWLSK